MRVPVHCLSHVSDDFSWNLSWWHLSSLNWTFCHTKPPGQIVNLIGLKIISSLSVTLLQSTTQHAIHWNIVNCVLILLCTFLIFPRFFHEFCSPTFTCLKWIFLCFFFYWKFSPTKPKYNNWSIPMSRYVYRWFRKFFIHLWFSSVRRWLKSVLFW